MKSLKGFFIVWLVSMASQAGLACDKFAATTPDDLWNSLLDRNDDKCWNKENETELLKLAKTISTDRSASIAAGWDAVERQARDLKNQLQQARAQSNQSQPTE